MTSHNESMPLMPAGATPSVVGSIREAARATNIDFALLMAQAQQESGFKADVRASSSSATGLFQFIDATWLDMVRQFGAKYGIGGLATAIASDSSGRAVVADPATRQRILDLRNNPRLYAALAAEYARLNKQGIEQALGRPASNAEVYLAHFLGANGAITFLRSVDGAHGQSSAAALLPDAAAANRSVFYDTHTGRPRTVGEVYRFFGDRIDAQVRQFADASAPSSGGGLPPPTSVAQALSGLPLLAGSPLAAMLRLFAQSTLILLAPQSTPPMQLSPAGRHSV